MSGCGVAVVGLGLAGCRRPPTRAEVLAALAREVGRADAVAIGGASEKLDTALAALPADPSAETLARERDECRQAILAWKRAYCFRNGPLVETNALLRVTFWPHTPRS